MTTPGEILRCPMGTNDAEAVTVGDYLASLLEEVWTQGEGFSGKRPFGNSGWETEITGALEQAGLATSPAHANVLVIQAIRAGAIRQTDEELPDPPEALLGLIGRDRVLIDQAAKRLHDGVTKHYNYTPIREERRGSWFELELSEDGHVARVDVTLKPR